MSETRNINEIVWRKDLYPRFEPNPATIDQYVDSIGKFPPIEINQHNELIDGYHRWTAHKVAGLDSIEVTVTQTESDRQFLMLAIKSNSTHGLPTSTAEKKHSAMMLYDGNNKAELAALLSVSEKTLGRWTSRTDKEMKERRNQIIADMWLACYTEEEIAEAVGCNPQTVHNQVEESLKIDNCPKLGVLANYQEPDWTPPLYNIWKEKEKTNSSNHFGNSEASFTDNLLYMYTKPFDIVVDPFGGGGATIDVCKKRLRRYWVSDRLENPKRPDLRMLDVTESIPALHKRWKDVSLVYLDPPYWKQAENQYSNDSKDLANMSLEAFYQSLTQLMGSCAARMTPGAKIALLIQPTQWKADDKQTVDHVVDLIIRSRTTDKIQYERRISIPYESQQYNAQQVEWTKANKDVLVLTREIIIWSVIR